MTGAEDDVATHRALVWRFALVTTSGGSEVLSVAEHAEAVVKTTVDLLDAHTCATNEAPGFG